MTQHEQEKNIVTQIAKAVEQAGGKVYFVGGYVRDKLMHIENKDIDVEVHGVRIEVLENILDAIGQKLEFGKSFGVYNLKGCSVDIAMPRKETRIGSKHTDFKIDVDPFLGTLQAARRRDFTINALMEDVLTGEVIDHFGGREDLANGVIRHIDDKTFAEDSLRVFRAAQFAARFAFEIAEETKQLCSNMEVSDLSRERVFEELKKALLQSKKPSLFFRQLYDMKKLEDWFLPVAQLIGVAQNQNYHKEGDVFTHTMMVLDEAAQKRNKAKNPLGFMLAALTHDFGKLTATEVVHGEIHAYQHAQAGVPLAEEFLRKLTNEKSLIRYVVNMVQHHMKPHTLFVDKSSVKATNKLFDHAAEPLDLIYLATADSLGKIPQGEAEMAEEFLLERLEIYREVMSRPYVAGADLIEAGIAPGRAFSELLAYAHKLRLAGVAKETALKQVLAAYKK